MQNNMFTGSEEYIMDIFGGPIIQPFTVIHTFAYLSDLNPTLVGF